MLKHESCLLCHSKSGRTRKSITDFDSRKISRRINNKLANIRVLIYDRICHVNCSFLDVVFLHPNRYEKRAESIFRFCPMIIFLYMFSYSLSNTLP